MSGRDQHTGEGGSDIRNNCLSDLNRAFSASVEPTPSYTLLADVLQYGLNLFLGVHVLHFGVSSPPKRAKSRQVVHQPFVAFAPFPPSSGDKLGRDRG